MNPRTLIALLVLLVGLGGFAWWQTSREAAAPALGESALLAGFDRARVRSFRLDHLTYSLQMEVRRGDDDRWRIVDPLDYPAEQGLVEALLAALADGRSSTVVDPDPKGLGLEPPHAVLEVSEQIGGSTRVHRLELGAPDVDGAHVFGRVDGKVVRMLGSVDNVIDRPRDGWRARSVFEFDPRAVVEWSRKGKLGGPTGEEVRDLELAALLGPTGWSALRPFEGALDPSRVLDWLRLLRETKARGFVDEASGRPEVVGLDQVDFEFEIATNDGARTALSLHRDRSSTAWYAKRSDAPWVWRLDPVTVDELAVPTEQFVDRQLVRVPATDVDQLHVVLDGAELWLERFESRWIVWSGAESGRSRSAPADTSAAELLIGKLVNTLFVQHVTDQPFASDDARAGIWFRVGGAPLGGRFGREVTTSAGGHGRLFQRDGESLVFLLDPSFMALLPADPTSLESRQVLRLRELDLVLASVTGLGSSHHYVRSTKGRWSPEGVDQEARQFAALVDPLIGLRAERWVARDDGGSLGEPIVVEFKDAFGNVASVTFGRAGDRVLVDFAGRRAQVDAALYGELAKLCAP
jgi:hypothetical protein